MPCPSTVETLRQETVYVPFGSSLTETDMRKRSLGSTLLSSLSTRCPSASSTSMLLAVGAIGSLNHADTCVGDVGTTESAPGSEPTYAACARTGRGVAPCIKPR